MQFLAVVIPTSECSSKKSEKLESAKIPKTVDKPNKDVREKRNLHGSYYGVEGGKIHTQKKDCHKIFAFKNKFMSHQVHLQTHIITITRLPNQLLKL